MTSIIFSMHAAASVLGTMAENALFVCYFDGTITIDPDTNVPTYDGGYCRPSVIKADSKFNEFMNRIYDLSSVSRRNVGLRVVCKWLFDHGESVPIEVSNDEDTAAVCAYAQKHSSTQLFVRKDNIFPTYSSSDEEVWM